MSDIDVPGLSDPSIQGLLPGYLARRRDEITLLSQALEAGDFEKIRVIGHNLHGSGGAYGLPRISDFGRELERGATDGAAETVRKAIEALAEHLDQIEALV